MEMLSRGRSCFKGASCLCWGSGTMPPSRALSRPSFLNGEVLDNGSLIVALVHFGALGDIGDVWDSFQVDFLVDLVVPSSLK